MNSSDLRYSITPEQYLGVYCARTDTLTDKMPTLYFGIIQERELSIGLKSVLKL